VRVQKSNIKKNKKKDLNLNDYLLRIIPYWGFKEITYRWDKISHLIGGKCYYIYYINPYKNYKGIMKNTKYSPNIPINEDFLGIRRIL